MQQNIRVKTHQTWSGKYVPKIQDRKMFSGLELRLTITSDWLSINTWKQWAHFTGWVEQTNICFLKNCVYCISSRTYNTVRPEGEGSGWGMSPRYKRIKESSFKHTQFSGWCWSSLIASHVPQFPSCLARQIALFSIKMKEIHVALWFSLDSLVGGNRTFCFSLPVGIFGALKIDGIDESKIWIVLSTTIANVMLSDLIKLFLLYYS